MEAGRAIKRLLLCCKQELTGVCSRVVEVAVSRYIPKAEPRFIEVGYERGKNDSQVLARTTLRM